MRGSSIQYLEKEVRTVTIRNNNATLAILDGMPVYFDNNDVTSVNFGTDVKSLSTALGTSPTGLFVGVAKATVAAGLLVGEVGEAVVYGFTDILITRRTRAASTDTWASIASQGAGDQWIGETIGNNFARQGLIPNIEPIPSGSTGQTVTLPLPVHVVGGQSLASVASAASTYGGALLYDAYRMKAFVRAM